MVGTLRSLPDISFSAEQVQTSCPQENYEKGTMPKQRAAKEFYTEAEAAAALQISVEQLHHVLDRHIFNNGTSRPAECTFRSSDLTLLRYWAGDMEAKILAMPRRVSNN